MGGEARVPPAAAADGAVRRAQRHRARAIAAFKQALDALFEAEPAERASLPVRELFAIANRPSLRLATLHGRPFPPPLAAVALTRDAAQQRFNAGPGRFARRAAQGCPPPGPRGADSPLPHLVTSR